MAYLSSALNFSLFFFGFVLGTALLFNNRKSLAFSFFGTYILVSSWGFLVSFLITSKLIFEFPHFFRTAAPLHYLWGPLCYLFVRNLLTSNNKFYKTDILHFIPFFFHFFELIPFFLSSATYKINMLNGMGVSDTLPEGLLPKNIHGILKNIVFLCYNIAQWRLLIAFNRTQNDAFRKDNLPIINWVVFLSAFGTILNASYLLQRLVFTNSDFFINFLLCIFYLYFASMWYGLLFNPDLLKGVKLKTIIPAQPVFEKEEQKILANELSEYDALVRRLENYMQVEQPFLSDQLSIAKLSTALYTPEYKISRCIKYTFNMHFPEYVNRYRINYIEDNFKTNAEWKHYTIDGMAFSAGFNSRNAFYSAFKKIKGITPTEFFKRA